MSSSRHCSTSDAQLIWSTRVGNVGPNGIPQYPGARSTPTVDGDVLYALGSDGDLTCIELAGGKMRWQKNLRSDFGGKPGTWAYSESPLIDGDVLVCTPGGSEATIVALHKKSGDVIWKSALAEGDKAAYASALIGRGGGHPAVRAIPGWWPGGGRGQDRQATLAIRSHRQGEPGEHSHAGCLAQSGL